MHKFLQSQDLNMAFELALSTSDLQLVMYLCHQVTPEEVFDKIPCPLSQPVLLSLIQQLSVNLNDQIELKTRYAKCCSILMWTVSSLLEGFSVIKLEIQFLMVVTKNLSNHPEPAEKPLLYFSVMYLSHSHSPIPLPLSHTIPTFPFQSQFPIPFQSPIPFPGT